MSKENKRDAGTLSEVLVSLHTQQQSGLLHVEWTQGGRLEKGELYLLNGQPVYARVGKFIGQEAFQRLLLWQPLRYSLHPDAPRPPANLSFRAEGFGVLPSPNMGSPTPFSSPAQNQGMPAGANFIPLKTGFPNQPPPSFLTHRQRVVYFLIDGQRSIADLARCSGKTILEVEEILQDFQRQGLVVGSKLR